MFLSVMLEVTNKENATVVPEEAIVSEGLRHIIFTVKDNVVERRVVRLGQRQEGRVEIVDGLQPGETIVVRGVQRVRAGAPVNPRPVGPEQPAAAGPATTPSAPANPQAAQPNPAPPRSQAAQPPAPAPIPAARATSAERRS
jgi:membrane fusion protein (multidrug efflux system)